MESRAAVVCSQNKAASLSISREQQETDMHFSVRMTGMQTSLAFASEKKYIQTYDT